MSFDVFFKSEKKQFVVDEKVIGSLEKIVPGGVSTREVDRVAYSKDFMPITLRWLLDGVVPALPDCIVWPESVDQVSEILKFASKNKIPVIPFGDGSGVLGSAIPRKGGIVLDVKKMNKIVEIDDLGLMARVQTGINGMNLERLLNRDGYTMGHIPQSLYCSSLGGWIACKAAGQFSTKYGKIEDMLVSLEAVLPDGTVISSKSVPRSSTGPAVERLFLGSEGKLGVVTEATVKIWPFPEKRAMVSFLFESLHDAYESTRIILRRGVYPAVMRIYDKNETVRHFWELEGAKDHVMLVLLCEGDEKVVDLEHEVCIEVCESHGGVSCGQDPVEHWLESRFNVREVGDFVPRGFIFDTIEVSVGWKDGVKLYENVIDAMRSVKGVVIASAHASHFYPQGVCFYFTFGGIPPRGVPHYEFYMQAWDAAMKAVVDSGGSISHHHGVGLTRAEWLKVEMGARMEMFKRIQGVLDPAGVMNPGKMGVD